MGRTHVRKALPPRRDPFQPARAFSRLRSTTLHHCRNWKTCCWSHPGSALTRATGADAFPRDHPALENVAGQFAAFRCKPQSCPQCRMYERRVSASGVLDASRRQRDVGCVPRDPRIIVNVVIESTRAERALSVDVGLTAGQRRVSKHPAAQYARGRQNRHCLRVAEERTFRDAFQAPIDLHERPIRFALTRSAVT
jgi:hypothetical protein